MPAEQENQNRHQDMKEKRCIVEAGGDSSIKVIPWSHIRKRRQIYRGAEAQVYEAELEPEGCIVAVREKFFPDSDDEEEGLPFCAEARLMARLHHPNIISFRGVAAHSDEIYSNSFDGVRDIVLDYMPDGNLYDAILEDQDFVLLPWRSRVLIAYQVAVAMDYLHTMGIIHFDLKAGNLLLDLSDPAQPVCKICDFETAMKKRDNISFENDVGTAGHVAPEVAFRWIITEKADIYSFGVLLRELLTGDQWPRPEINNDQDLVICFLQDVQQHRSVPDWCYNKWKELMKDCLAIQGAKRPGFAQIIARLRLILDALPYSPEGMKSCTAVKNKLAISSLRPALRDLDCNIVMPMD